MIIIMNIQENINLILLTLLVFHFDISGKDNNDEHPPNIAPISVILLIFNNLIFSIDSFLFFISNSSF